MSVYCIIVTYNAEKWIEQCLSSLHSNQDDVNVIVVDNASTDDTVTKVRRFEDVIYIPLTENIGFGRANNLGMTHALQAQADYVFLLNQDAYVYPDTIKKLVDSAQVNPDFSILSPVHLNGDGSQFDPAFLEYLCSRPAKALFSDLYLRDQVEALYETTYINAAAWLIPCSKLAEIGGFDPLYFLYGEDDDFVRRCLYLGYKVGLVANARICHYREHSTPSGSIRQVKYFARKNRAYSCMVSRLKDPARGFTEQNLRLPFYALVQVLFCLSRREFDAIPAWLSAYGRTWKNLSIIHQHRRQSLTHGAHWLTAQ